MFRKAFSMVELIMTIVIMGILSGGAYVSMAHLYTKAAKTKAISELSFDTTLISNQISALLLNRIPASVIGSDKNGSFISIYNIDANYTTLEWIGRDFESYFAGNYSGFIDFKASDKTTLLLNSPDTHIERVLTKDNETALMFSGSFDEGSVGSDDSFTESFGWHEHNASEIFSIDNASTDNNITLLKKPDVIYEKYSLVSSAYAIARLSDVNATCESIKTLDKTENSLLLFYNFKPWKKETFCDDANVTILSNEAKGFTVDFINGNLQFNLTLQREIRKSGKNLIVEISKQKVVF